MANYARDTLAGHRLLILLRVPTQKQSMQVKSLAIVSCLVALGEDDNGFCGSQQQQTASLQYKQ